MIVLDTWQYFMHRYMHHNKFLYRHIHSQHHRLVVPYAYGALYNHPVEGLLLDTVGGALSFLISGMSPRTSIFFFSFATIKTVDDHCGLCLPGNLFHMVFKNNSAYHDVHHQLYGSKYNFSQPFFSVWDRILGTYMPYSLEKREGGGFEARPTKEFKDDWVSFELCSVSPWGWIVDGYFYDQKHNWFAFCLPLAGVWDLYIYVIGLMFYSVLFCMYYEIYRTTSFINYLFIYKICLIKVYHIHLRSV